MDIELIKAVLHILDTESAMPVYSKKELSLEDGRIQDFIVKHAEKIITDGYSKSASFKSDSKILKEVMKLDNSIDSFLEVSTQIAKNLFDIIRENPSVKGGDLLEAVLRIDDILYLSIIKINYKEGYTHYVEHDADGEANKIIVYKTLFPSENQKNDESALISLSDYSVRLTEKKYEINGEKKNYFSEMFLECMANLSEKESLKIINKTAKEIGEKYYDNSFETVSNVNDALYDEIQQKGSVSLAAIAEKTFDGNPEIQKEYIEKVYDSGVKSSFNMTSKEPEKKFSKRKIKTDNGIELSLPTELYKDKNTVEIINAPDGTISILLKNINKIINK